MRSDRRATMTRRPSATPRRQDFIRWAEKGCSISRLLANGDKLLRSVGEQTRTDKSRIRLPEYKSLMPTPRTPTSITPTAPIAGQMLAIAASLVR
jgi:hypothetical protein